MKTKLLGTLAIALGVFLCAGVAAASDADVLQPASDIVYNEQLIVNNTAKFDSIYVGKQGVGGVTFFNGTIVNSTTGEGGSDNPVTFGDQVRIDGGIYNTEIGGDHALKIFDSMNPGLTKANNLGSASLRWNDLYVVNGNFSGAVTIQGGTVWTNKNDGSGSGLDADKLDGIDSTEFATATHNHDSRYYVNKTETRYLSINGSEFIPINNSSSYNISNYNGGIYTSSTTPAIVAPISLPHNAVITEFKVYYFDDDTDNFNVYLRRSNNAGMSQGIAAIDTGSTTDASSKSSTLISYGEIDNTTYSYLVSAESFKASNTGEQQLYSVRIKYTIDQPLP